MARSRRPIRILVAALVVCCASVLLLVGFRVQQTLRQVGRAQENEHRLNFTLRPFDTGRHSDRFQLLPAASNYSSVATLDGNFYLAGPEGLTVLAPDGTERARLRTGLELPVAALAAVTTGRLRGATEPQVLLATAGAGVLMLTTSRQGIVSAQQLLPARPETADISALLVESTGDLLLGTRHAGVLTFNGATLEPVAMHLNGVDAGRLEVTALAAADPASVLVGTRGQGVIYLHAGTAERAGAAQGMPDDQVESLAVAGGHAFIGTPLGVAEFAPGGEGLRPVRTLAKGTFAHALSVAEDGRTISIGTLDRGVQEVSLGGNALLHRASITMEPAGDTTDRVDQFLDAHGVRFALVNGRLVARDGSGWSSAATPARMLHDRNVSALAFDDQGALFVGYFDHGLDVLANGAVTHFEDDSLFCVNRLVLDPRRRTMAAATANGLVLFDEQGTPRQTLTRRDGLLSEHVTDVAFSHAGTVLATPAGLTFLNATGTESLYAFEGLVNNHVYALAADPATDHVLAGTLGGLSMLDAEQVRRNLTVQNSGLKHNWITALAQSGPGEWLVGTYGAGVLRLSAQGAFAPMDLPAGLRHDLVINPNALLITPTHFYAGTLGEGMLVYSKAKGRWTAVTFGLPSLNVTSFAARDGELYIGTDNGLVSVAEASL